MATRDLPPLERGHGVAEIVFEKRGPVTRLSHLYQRAPCRVLTPLSEAGEPPQAVLLTTSGGLANGDKLDLSLSVGPDSAAAITTQAAEKVYRARDEEPVHLRARIDVATGAWLEWLPQETILFEGARFNRRAIAKVASGGRLLACDTVVFGRLASGERFSRGFLHDSWDIRRDGRLSWRDALRLDEGVADTLSSPGGFGGAEAIASAFYIGDDAAGHLETARTLIDAGRARSGVTLVNDILVARWLGDAVAVRAALADFLIRFRAAVGGWPARLPRVWHC
jgi:urease accessory protein